MKSATFVSDYSREIPHQRAINNPIAELMSPAEQFSSQFGTVLHDRLSDPTCIIAGGEEFYERYYRWVHQELDPINSAVESDNSSRSLRASNELNFHRLNRAMLGMWEPIFDPIYFDKTVDHQQHNRFAKDYLAIQGLYYYNQREKLAGSEADFAFFEKANADKRASFEGMVHEFDAAIVLLDFVRKHPELTVVPAPSQFEHSDNKSHNADFVVVSKEGATVGVQIKSIVEQKHIDTYDPDRIVLIDARKDLGNELFKRTERKSSTPHRVSWAGIICAQQVESIVTQGKNRSLLTEVLPPQVIVAHKWIAKNLLRGIKPTKTSAVQIIGERVLSHL